MEDGNTCTREFIKSHPFSAVAGDVRLKSRSIEVNRNFRDVVLNSSVVKFSHGQQDRNWTCQTSAIFVYSRPQPVNYYFKLRSSM